MKNPLAIVILSGLLGVALAPRAALAAGPARDHLELNLALGPFVTVDEDYVAFSDELTAVARPGLDLRWCFALSKRFELGAGVGYRLAFDDGQTLDALETNLASHDLTAEIRLRAWLTSIFGIFLSAKGGAVYFDLVADDLSQATSVPHRYTDTAWTWEAGGLLGADLRISPDWLARRGIKRFGFGFEAAGGWLSRGEIEWAPELSGGDDGAIAVGGTRPWGTVDPSGWLLDFGFTLSFLL